MTGQTATDYTIRQAAYDLRKPRGKHLVDKPRRTRHYHVPDQPAHTIAALLALRNQIIGPIIAGVRSPRMGRRPTHWNQIDRDYEALRIGMQTHFDHLAITTGTAAA
jgi:hypothetical protein